MKDLLKALEALRGYRFILWRYHKSHSELTIRAEHPDKPGHNVHIHFVDVYYIQMPTGWIGDFELGSESEFKEVLRKAWLQGSPEVREIFTLFKADTPNDVVYILGSLSHLEYDVEPIYTPTLPLERKEGKEADQG